MKPHETGYSAAVPDRPVTDGPTTAFQAFCSAAAVMAVVMLIGTVLVLGVYAVVFVDLMPQMQ
jgi:hypothetical protein